MVTIKGSTNSSLWTFALDVYENSTSVENNTSNVTVKVFVGRSSNSGSYMYGAKISGSVSVTGCANQAFSYNNAGTVNIAAGGWLNIATLTFPSVPHNDDGSKVVTIGASFTNNISPSSGSASGSVTLTTIPRASQPSLITYPESTQKVGVFGTTISVHMNRKSSSFTHTVRYEFGDLSGTCIDAETGKAATGIENGFRWKVPESFMNEIPAALSGSGRIYVDTYNGTKKIGTKYSGFTATVPTNVKPNVSYTLEDITGVDDIYGSPVKLLSKIKVKITATPAYSSPIASYEITANGKRYNTAEATTDFLRSTDEDDCWIQMRVTDKRGRDTITSYLMDVQDYTPPAVTKLTAIRCNQDGTANKRGAFVNATFSAVVSSMDNKNTASYSIKYKKTSETEWETVFPDANGKNPSILNNNFAPSDQSFVFAADTGNSYDVMVSAVDRHNSSNPATKSVKAPTAFAIFSWRGFKNSSGNKEDGAGIGKVPEKPNCLQVGWDSEFEKEVYYKGKTLLNFFYPVGSIYIAYNHTNPGTLFGGTWVRMQDGFLWASRSTDIIGQTGGEKTHTLTVDELPAHSHGSVYSQHAEGTKDKAWYTTSGSSLVYGTVSTGGNAAHNNMPPYIQVSIWRRTA